MITGRRDENNQNHDLPPRSVNPAIDNREADIASLFGRQTYCFLGLGGKLFVF